MTRKNYVSPMAKVMTLNVKKCICESEIADSNQNPDRPVDDVILEPLF